MWPNKFAMPASILITGATGSIGGALAQWYAAPGRTLVLQGRRQGQLEQLAHTCRQAGAEVHIAVLDVKNCQALQQWARQAMEQHEFDLVVVNAGVNTHVRGGGQLEPFEQVSELIDVNLRASLALVDAIVPFMVSRGRGQIALLSSLAAYYGLPLTPAYSASKAALKAYGEGLRGYLAPHGVGVTVVLPGYVSSPMCHAMPGPKPFLWAPERAARCIGRGLRRNPPRISFPFPLNFSCWGLSVLRPTVAQWLLQRFGYGKPPA